PWPNLDYDVGNLSFRARWVVEDSGLPGANTLVYLGVVDAGTVPVPNPRNRFTVNDAGDCAIIHDAATKLILPSGSWPAGTEFEIISDGKTWRYYVNGKVLYSGPS